MGAQDHVTLFEVSDWSLAFCCHGNQDGGQHSKNNIFVQLVQNSRIKVVMGAQDHVTSYEVFDWSLAFCCHGN